MGLFDLDTDRSERLATRLSDLVWEEISGCDHPANLAPGWMLRKSAEGDDARHAESLPAVVSAIREELRKELAPIATAVESLNKRLDHVEGR